MLCIEHNANDGLRTSAEGLQHSVLVKVPAALMEKSGDYRFVISAKDSHADREKGHRQKWALERNQQFPYAAIAKVEWFGYNPGDGKTNYEKGTNPSNRGGGDRIFAERNQPPGRQGDQLHDKIRILATLKDAPRSGTRVTIYFRLFDPDHYSSDPAFDPNIIEGDPDHPNDNMAAGGQPVQPGGGLKTADFSADATSVTLVGDGVTKGLMMGLEITARQPCNNFKVMACWSQKYLSEIDFGIDGMTLKEKMGQGPNVVKELQTDLLTVWRTLYVERDSMGDPVYTQGPAPSRIESGNITGTGAYSIITDVTIYAPGGTNQFQGGRIELLTANDVSLGIFNVEGNTTGNNSRVTLSVAVPQGAAKFRNLEDDDIAHGVTTAEMRIDDDTISLWASRYEPACVKVNPNKTDLSPLNADNVNSNNITFETNIGTEGTLTDAMAKIKAKIRANKQSVSSPDFWVIYQLGAFQEAVHQDGDPSPSETATMMGVSSWYSDARDDAEAGTMLFREATRDSKLGGILASEANLWRLLSVHESAYEFGLIDGDADGPIMHQSNIFRAVTQADIDALVFNGSGLKKIMLKSFPGSRYN